VSGHLGMLHNEKLHDSHMLSCIVRITSSSHCNELNI
jgi:hypothetical protein